MKNCASFIKKQNLSLIGGHEMILHPDGRIEGTPEEIAAYKHEQEIAAQLDELAENLLLYGIPFKPKKERIWGDACSDDLIPKGPGNSIEQQNKYGHMRYTAGPLLNPPMYSPTK